MSLLKIDFKEEFEKHSKDNEKVYGICINPIGNINPGDVVSISLINNKFALFLVNENKDFCTVKVNDYRDYCLLDWNFSIKLNKKIPFSEKTLTIPTKLKRKFIDDEFLNNRYIEYVFLPLKYISTYDKNFICNNFNETVLLILKYLKDFNNDFDKDCDSETREMFFTVLKNAKEKIDIILNLFLEKQEKQRNKFKQKHKNILKNMKKVPFNEVIRIAK